MIRIGTDDGQARVMTTQLGIAAKLRRKPSLCLLNVVIVGGLLSFAIQAAFSSQLAAAAGPTDNVIVKQSQNVSDPTSWLLISGVRYWIPTGAIFNCLKAAGVPGPVYLSNHELDARPDQRGQHASCGGGNNPRGSFDALSSGYGSVNVAGWATDPNVRTRSLHVHIYVGGPAGAIGAEGHDIGVASAYRPDVNRVYPGDGEHHGFSSSIATGKAGMQQVCAYAINVGPGGNAALGCKTISILFRSPYALGAPWKPGTYAFPMNAFGFCNKGPGANVDPNGVYDRSWLVNVDVKTNGASVKCDWWSQLAEPAGVVPAGTYPTPYFTTFATVCRWMTGEGWIVNTGGAKCLWTKSWSPVVGADGRYR